MPDSQILTLALATAPTTIAVLIGVLINNSRLSDTNARIADLKGDIDARIGDLNASVTARFAETNSRIADLNASVTARFAETNTRIADLTASVKRPHRRDQRPHRGD